MKPNAELNIRPKDGVLANVVNRLLPPITKMTKFTIHININYT